MKNSSAVMKRKNPKMTTSKKMFIIIFGLPTFLLYLYISILPMLKSVKVSFYDWSGYSPDMTFLGFDNYKEILSDPIFLKAMVNDLTIIFWKEILITVLALLFALAVTRFKLKKPEVAFVRFLFYIPDILSIIVISTVWLFIFNPNVGLLNGVLQALHLDFLIPINGWLTGETLMPSIIFVAVWSGIGYFMIVLIAAINDVPKELYESAEIDGAGQCRQLIYVTIPNIWSQIRFVMVTILFSSISANMTLIMPLTNGGPDNASMVMGLYAYTVGVDPAVSRVGYANAAAVILMIISFTVSFVFNHLLAKKDDK